MTIIKYIQNAFAERSSYKVISLSEQLSAEEKQEVNFFENQNRYNLTGDILEEHFEAISWFSPEAFCFFLPGILTTGIREHTDLLMYDSIIFTLDRSPNIDFWDEFFIKRWTLLTNNECDAVQRWLLWLLDNSTAYDAITLDRAFETLELLKSQLLSHSQD